VTRKVPTASSVGWLAWSANDAQIAFSVGLPRPSGTIEDVYLVDTTGRHQRRLARGSAPQWSPDGTALAIQEGQNPDNYPVTVIRPDGHRLWGHAGVRPRWSPDGKRIAFWVGGWVGAKSLITTPAGRMLATLPGWFDTWSPNRRMTYVTREAARRPLYVADWSGGHRRRIAESGEGAIWAPDGERLIFGGRVGGRDGVHLVMTAGGPARRLPATSVVEWLATGDLLAYAKDALVIMRPDGGIRTTFVRRPARAEEFRGVGRTRDGRVVYRLRLPRFHPRTATAA
jgi:Tol biopolymer transport system component